MTITSLTQLHSRKLTELRAHSQKHIDLWRDAVEVVSKAERESKCIIGLPSELTDGPSLMDQQLKSVNYMKLLEMEKDVVRERGKIYDFAISKLNRMISHLEQTAANTGKPKVAKQQNIYRWNDIMGISLSILFTLFIWLFFTAIIETAFPGPGSSGGVIVAFFVSIYPAIFLAFRASRLISGSVGTDNLQQIQVVNQELQRKVGVIQSSIEQIEAHRKVQI